jgi:hypothetical protein
LLQGPLQQRWKLGSSPFHELSNAGGAEAEGLGDHRLRHEWEEATAD